MKSPEVMRVEEVEGGCDICDGCDKELKFGNPVLVIEVTTCVCLGCVEGALPEMKDIIHENHK